VLQRLHWLGHASFRVAGDPTIYIDPWKVASRAPSADIVLVTHGHYDHCSKADIDKICTPTTTVVIPASCANTFGREAVTMAPWDETVIAGVRIQAVPAYNAGKAFHPKANGWLGYVIHLPDGRLWHAGDTDLIPEMTEFEADVALVPVGGTYTMTAAEAVEAVARVGATTAVPMHWGEVVGDRSCAAAFAAAAAKRGIQVKILDSER